MSSHYRSILSTPVAYSLQFDGGNKRVGLDSAVTTLSNTQNFTFSFLVKYVSSASTQVVFISSTNDGEEQFRVDINSSDRAIARLKISGIDYVTRSDFISEGWNHIAIVYTGTEASSDDRFKIYINSVYANVSYSGTIPTTTPVIDGFAQTGTNSFIGMLNRAAVFNYSASQSDIDKIYNAGIVGDLLNTPGLTAPVNLWRFGNGNDYWDGSDWICYDTGTVGGNNGTSNNMEKSDRVVDAP